MKAFHAARLALPAGLVVGLALVPLRVMGPTLHRVPGDLVDARFNNYVLEHGYRWLTGREPSFWDAAFFLPEPNVIAYSDCHLGTLPLYALFRLIGADRETAFQLWALALFALNYLSCAWVLRRIGFGRAAAAAGAYVFTFGMPVVGQINHLQLAPRFLVPVAFLLAVRFLHRPSARVAAGLGACLVWQLYCTIYVGFFLVFTLAAFVPVYAWVRRHELPWREVFWRSAPDTLARLLVVAGCGLALVPLALPHLRAARTNGYPDYGQVASMQPRWQSWLTPPDGSLAWSWLRPLADGQPMVHEHAIFFGAVPVVAVTLALVGRRRCGRDPLAQAAAVGIVLVLLFTLVHLPLYRHFARLPLASSMRAVTRVALVAAFPVAIAVAALVTRVVRLTLPSRTRVAANRRSLIRAAVMAFVVYDQTTLRRHGMPSFDKTHARERVERLTAKLTDGAAPPRPFAYVTKSVEHNWDWHYQQVDAMLAAQALGVATVNGYSGNFPRGWHPPRGPVTVAQWLRVASERNPAAPLGQVAVVYED